MSGPDDGPASGPPLPRPDALRRARTDALRRPSRSALFRRARAAAASPALVAATRRQTRPGLDPWWLAGGLFVLYTLLSVTRFRRLGTMSWDLSIFEQAVRAYARFQAPVVDIKGPGVNILGDHFSPIVSLIAPLYWISPSPVTLLVVQALLFALSAVPVARVAAHHLGRARGAAVGVAYGFSWGVQKAVDFDFHEICFAMPLIAFSLEAVLRGRVGPAVLWAAPLVLVKEDLGATVAAIGLVLLVRSRGAGGRRARWAAIGLMGFGTAMCALTLGVLIPAFNEGGDYVYWEKIGGADDAPTERVPVDQAVRTLLWILLPTSGLLALRSPLLLAALPTLGWRFLSHNDLYWTPEWHYSAVLMPVVFLALVDAVRLLAPGGRRWLSAYAGLLPSAAAAAALALTVSLPLSALTQARTYERDERVAAIETMLARIPDGATVEANVGPMSRLTSRCRVFWAGDTRGVTPQYIVLDVGNRPNSDGFAFAERAHPEARYTLTDAAHEYLVLKRAAD